METKFHSIVASPQYGKPTIMIYFKWLVGFGGLVKDVQKFGV